MPNTEIVSQRPSHGDIHVELQETIIQHNFSIVAISQNT